MIRIHQLCSNFVKLCITYLCNFYCLIIKNVCTLQVYVINYEYYYRVNVFHKKSILNKVKQYSKIITIISWLSNILYLRVLLNVCKYYYSVNSTFFIIYKYNTVKIRKKNFTFWVDCSQVVKIRILVYGVSGSTLR